MTGAIAHVGPNIPQELLRASGRHAGPLPFEVDRPTPVAEQWMESKFAPWARSILEGWAAGDYDHLVQVVFSRADDSAQRLYYYLCELQRRGLVAGPDPLILDIAKIPRASSLTRTELALRQLAQRLEIHEAALIGAIEACNAERAARAPDPGLGRRCLLVGTPPPDRRLHKAAATAGFLALGPTLAETWSQLGPTTGSASDEPFEALARQAHADPMGPRSFAEAGAVLAKSIIDATVDAVVLWQIEEDEAQAWHLPAQRAALAAAGVPSLVMTRRDWLARDGAPGEIAGFLKGIGR